MKTGILSTSWYGRGFFKMNLEEWTYPALDIRRIAKPRDPIVSKQLESIMKRVEIHPPECDDLEEIEQALKDYGME